jgi:type IV pilus assembly protein PilC
MASTDCADQLITATSVDATGSERIISSSNVFSAGVAGACGNIIYTEAVLKMREEVATGQRLQFAMQQAGLWPNMVVQMVAIGEESGAMDSMLLKVADFFDEEVDNLVDNLSSLMEPIIMAILGILVGGLVVAMYLPIFKMGAAVH